MTLDQLRPNGHEFQANKPDLQAALDTGNFDGMGLIFSDTIFDTTALIRILHGVGNVLQRIEEDEQIPKIAAETKHPNHFRVQVRERALALEALLPLIAEIPALTLPEEYDAQDDTRRKINLVYATMFIATGRGYRSWPIPYDELLAMPGAERVAAIERVFADEKYKTVFEFYQSHNGLMPREQYEAALEYIPTAEEVTAAEQRLREAGTAMFTTTEMVDTELATAAAKILSVMQPETNNYLLAESMIFVGRV